ncbi:hypothetical protein [Rhodococcus sp. B10]|uniref:hypothetical protein n=1 Tax=Rhodococcus sp. B10 TaxID=2695876 RepID=UPI00142FBBCA|nr:hypothetical protein [Rhodococcus sp. B10]NIL77653.1 hypothetical protein [Rhodococcus sp. B10]
MTWIEIVGGVLAAAAILLGATGIILALRESDTERGLTYPYGSTERRALTGKENPPHAMVQS